MGSPIPAASGLRAALVERAAGPRILPLDLERVSFAVDGHVIIDDVSLRIDGQCRTVILGANGAGKSVLMRLMHGLLVPSRGRIRWAGADARPTRQAMVFQRPVMLRRSALANITYALSLSKVAHGERAARARDALTRVGLAHAAHRSARVLSGGEQQKLALARAWALEPRVLFADEPTASLDPTATREIEDILAGMDAAGTQIVMTTHNLGQARRLADEIVFLHRGRVVEQTPVGRFFSQPQSVEAAAFIKGELPWV
jgi:tungstate transport system ATP-binding protein